MPEDKARFTFDELNQSIKEMTDFSSTAYQSMVRKYKNFQSESTREYDLEQVERILKRGSLEEQIALSRYFFTKSGFYKRMVLHYATLLKYTGVLIPNTAPNKSLEEPTISKQYNRAMDYIEKMNWVIRANNIATRVLVDGTYYGVINLKTPHTLTIIDLPINYCRTNFKDKFGNDVIEFDVSYFETITDEKQRKSTLSMYPKEIANYYRAWVKDQSKDEWMFIPSEIGVCFQLFDGSPLLLQVIPAIIKYEEKLDVEDDRDLEEIKKILIQKMPITSAGELVFEPNEAAEMHKGAVNMLKDSNPNISVMTTYGDIDSIGFTPSSDTATNNAIERTKNNIYDTGGVSSQLFASTGNIATQLSLKNDLALMMILGNKMSIFISSLINQLYSKNYLTFRYYILPVSWYNEREYIDSTYRMINTGYSLILPTIAQGFSQRDLGNLKDVENKIMGLSEKMLPPLSAATGGGSSGDEGGRPPREDEEKDDKTIQNIESEEENA